MNLFANGLQVCWLSHKLDTLSEYKIIHRGVPSLETCLESKCAIVYNFHSICMRISLANINLYLISTPATDFVCGNDFLGKFSIRVEDFDRKGMF